MNVNKLTKHDVIARLQEHGITPTQQRIQIAQLLFSRPQHVSAEQVLEIVNDGRTKVSKATVYNTLNLFAREGLVREVLVDPTKIFYDSNVSEHHHFFNVDTGVLTDVPGERLSVEHLPDAPEGTVALGVDVIIRVRSAQEATN